MDSIFGRSITRIVIMSILVIVTLSVCCYDDQKWRWMGVERRITSF